MTVPSTIVGQYPNEVKRSDTHLNNFDDASAVELSKVRLTLE